MASARPHIFLSYARADDEAFAGGLRDDLMREGIEVWWDRVSMQSRGRTFFVELRDAIEAADRVLAVIGPGAVASPYVRSEWEHAVLFSKAVLPVLRMGDYDLVPAEFTDLHTVDLRPHRERDAAMQELVRLLREPVAPLAPIPWVPALPKYFLPRRSDIARLSDVVLADARRPAPVGGAGQTTALHGMGGIGKSVVAAALARTAEARRIFANGIVWLKMGKHPDLLSAVRVLGAAFRQDLSQYSDEKVALTFLPEVLQPLKCMVVLDDVWSLEHATPFHNALGPLCRLLITTRDAGLAAALGTDVNLDFLTPADGLRLLADSAGQLPGQLPEAALQVARECGNLPLALAMAGGIARGKEDWTGVLARLRSADLAKIRGTFPDYPYPDLLRAFEASIDYLDGPVRARYFDLAVLAENTPIPEAALETFWKRQGLDRFDVEDTVSLFVERSLARRTNSRSISLHDLQLVYVRAGTPSLPELQQRFADAYLQGKDASAWALLPDDGYFYEHITWHLEQAGWPERIHALLAASREDGRNAWHEAASQAGRLVSYHADLARGARLATAAGDVVLQIRYALIAASIRSSTDRISPALLKQLLATGTWTEARALDYAMQIPDMQRKAASLASLAELLSPRGREEILAAARDAQEHDGSASAVLVGALARCGDPDLAHEAFAVAKTLRFQRDRAAAIAATAPYLPDQFLDHVLPLLEDLDNNEDKLAVMGPVVSRMSEQGLDDLFRRCREDFYGVGERAAALRLIAPYLPAESLPPNDSSEYSDADMVVLLPYVAAKVGVSYALRRARRIGEWHRPEAVAAVVTVVARTDPQRAMHWMRRIHDEKFKAVALAQSAAHFTGDVLVRAMRTAEKMRVRECRATALAGLCTNLAPEARQKALAQAVKDLLEPIYLEHSEGRRVNAILRVIPQLCRFGHSEAALQLVRSIEDGPRRAEALASIGDCLAEGSIQAALEMAFELPGDQPRATGLAGIARRLPEPLLLKARAELRSPESLAVVAPYLPPKELENALNEVETKWVYSGIPLGIDALAPSLKDPALLHRAVGIASAIHDGYEQVTAECSLARLSTEPRHNEIVYDALERASNILDYGSRFRALVAVAKQAPAEWAGRLEEEAVALRYDVYSEPLRAATAARLFDLGAWDAAISIAGRIESNLSKTEALLSAARRASGPLIDPLMRVISGTDDDDLQLDLLAALAPRLTPAQLRMALRIVRKIKFEESRSRGLAELAGHLPPDRLDEALQCARKLRGKFHRARALAGIAPHLEPGDRGAVVAEAVADVTSKAGRAVESERDRAEAIESLAPLISEGQMEHVLRAIRKIDPMYESYALQALTALAPVLPAGAVPQFLNALEAFDSTGRWETNGAFIARLVQLSDTTLARKIFDRLRMDGVNPQAWLAMALGPGLGDLESDFRIRWYSWDDRDRADAISGLPGPFCDRLAARILLDAVQESPKNVAVFGAVLPRIAGWPREALLEVWNELYPRFASRQRALVLHDIDHMAAMLNRLEERPIAERIAGAIQDVVRSWP